MDERHGDPDAAGSPRDGTGTVRIRIDGGWQTGTYEIAGRIMIVRSQKGSRRACVGLFDHVKLAKAVLLALHERVGDDERQRTRRSGPAPVSASTQGMPCGDRREASEAPSA